MKLISKLTLAVVALATVNFAQAGDPAPRWQAEIQRQREADRNWERTTVGVYAKGGVGQRMVQARSGETHLEFRTNAHGQTTATYVPGAK